MQNCLPGNKIIDGRFEGRGAGGEAKAEVVNIFSLKFKI